MTMIVDLVASLIESIVTTPYLLLTAVVFLGLSCYAAAMFYRESLSVMFSNIENIARLMFRHDVKTKVRVFFPPQITQVQKTDGEEDTGKGEKVAADCKGTSVLLLILPGSYLKGEDYADISKTMQREAMDRNISLTVGVGFLNYTKYDKWLCSNNYGVVLDMIQETVVDIINADHKYDKEISLQEKNSSPSVQSLPYSAKVVNAAYDKVFVMGHSLGGVFAKDAAYPSKYDGLILYGTSLQALNPRSVSSYPKPTLQIIGSRDGFTRYLSLASEFECLDKDLSRRMRSIGNFSGIRTHSQEQIEESLMLTNPAIVLPELNHFHMSTGELPKKTRASGRSDFTSNISNIDEAHRILGRTVVDFINIHSSDIIEEKVATTTRKNNEICVFGDSKVTKEQSCKNILSLVHTTKSEYMSQIRELLDPAYVSRFLENVQKQILNMQQSQSVALDITSTWHDSSNDFLYSRPQFISQTGDVMIELTEQDPLRLSTVPQISKTIAMKGKSQEAILNCCTTITKDATSFQAKEGATTTAPSLMTINERTFQMVLNEVVTTEQKKRYIMDGKQLKFGPDILVEATSLVWLNTPISVERIEQEVQEKEGKEADCKMKQVAVYYLLRSPCFTTPLTPMNKNTAGMWYAKPLTPSQAYEWIVFDAFKQ